MTVKSERPRPGSRVNTSHAYARGLIGAWLLNDGAGSQAIDSSVYGNRVALTNLDLTAAWTGSDNGGALEFDGVDDFGRIGSNPNLTVSTGITVACWIQSDTVQDDKGIIGEYTSSFGWLIWLLPTSGFVAGIIRVGASSKPVNTSLSDITEWTHVVMTWGASNTMRMVINGSDVTTGTTTSGPIDDAGQVIDIGRRSELSAKSYAGKMRDVLLYDRGMTVKEATGLYQLDLGELFSG